MTYEVKSKRARRVVGFIEEFLVVPEGKDVGKPVRLRDWQLEFIDKVHGTPTRRAILSMGRKNGKSAITHGHAAAGPLGRADGMVRVRRAVRRVSGAAGAGGRGRGGRRSRRPSGARRRTRWRRRAVPPPGARSRSRRSFCRQPAGTAALDRGPTTPPPIRISEACPRGEEEGDPKAPPPYNGTDLCHAGGTTCGG